MHRFRLFLFPIIISCLFFATASKAQAQDPADTPYAHVMVPTAGVQE
jgi:hypothetical protein